MQNRWNNNDAEKTTGDLEMRAYSSRLIGLDSELVLHGGGNTSVKSKHTDIFGQETDVIFVKASGFDLGKMGTEGFTGLELDKLIALSKLAKLSDPDMVREVKRAQIDPSAANASIEAIVHAVIPHKYVDHSHADAILTVSNSNIPETVWQEIFGENVAVLPYIKPGFDLAKQIAEFAQGGGFDNCDCLVLKEHGLFTFHEDAKTSYERHVELVAIAEDYLAREYGAVENLAPESIDPIRLAKTRKAVGTLAQKALVSRPACQVPNESLAFLEKYAQKGTVTPEHVIHNKPFPAFIGEDIDASLETFVTDYQAYFDRANDANLMRLPLNPHWAVFKEGQVRSFGPNVKRAQVSADVANTTVRAMRFAEKTGSWQGLGEQDLRDLEYWELEQAKLKKQPAGPELTGKVAIVTGAAAGIGLTTAKKLHERGAVVVGLDINPKVTEALQSDGLLGIAVDLTDDKAIVAAINTVVEQFGGVDIVVSNAGIFQSGAYVENLDDANWQRSIAINLEAHMRFARAVIPFLRHGFDPSMLFIASRNVAAPGAGAASYSVAKAGLTQLMRVLALELAPDGITVNALHPDAVFDTEIWTEEALKKSADRYGLTVEEYKNRNLLKAEITSHHVAQAALAMVNGEFCRTTGAQIPVDGGNDRVI